MTMDSCQFNDGGRWKIKKRYSLNISKIAIHIQVSFPRVFDINYVILILVETVFHIMKHSSLIYRACRAGAFAIGVLHAGLAAAATPAIDLAVATAAQWVGLADKGQTERMWNLSGPIMQKNTRKDDWAKYLANVHAQLGNVADRQWSEVVRIGDTSNLPRGEYVNVMFLTHFTRGTAIEKVSLLQEGSLWTPVGYVVNRIQPGAAPAPSPRKPASGR